MTVAMLMQNTVKSAQKVAQRIIDMEFRWPLKLLSLSRLNPVPRYLYIFYIIYFLQKTLTIS